MANIASPPPPRLSAAQWETTAAAAAGGAAAAAAAAPARSRFFRAAPPEGALSAGVVATGAAAAVIVAGAAPAANGPAAASRDSPRPETCWARRRRGAEAEAEAAVVGYPLCVLRVAARGRAERAGGKWASPVRPEVDVLRVGPDGAEGDYNHYRATRFKGTGDRAVSFVTSEALASLRKDGFDVGPGDLGENVTLEAPEALLAAGVRLRAARGMLELELTEPITPCRNLEYIPSLLAMPEAARRRFPRDCKGRRGWHARVLSGGELRAGDTLEVVVDTRPRPSAAPQPEQPPSPSQKRRWRGGGSSRGGGAAAI